MKRRLNRIPVFSIVSLLLLAAVVVFWVRSRRHADIVGYYTPAGHLQGFSNDKAGLIVFFSDIPFGPEMGLSGDAMSASADEFVPIHDLLFDPSNVKWHHMGFQFGSAPIGSWGWKFSAWIVPYWALIIPLAILPLIRLRRFLILRRRIKRGQCLACGYDLRHSEGRCPECGAAIGAEKRPGAPQDIASPGSARLAGIIPWVLLTLFLMGTGGSFWRGLRATARAAIAPPEVEYQSGVLRRVGLPGQSSGDVQHWTTPQDIQVGPTSAAPKFIRSYPVADLLIPRNSINSKSGLRPARSFTRAIWHGRQLGSNRQGLLWLN